MKDLDGESLEVQHYRGYCIIPVLIQYVCLATLVFGTRREVCNRGADRSNLLSFLIHATYVSEELKCAVK